MQPPQFTLRRLLMTIVCFASACAVVSLIFRFAHTNGPGGYVIALPLLLFAPLYVGLAGAGVGALAGRPIAGFASGFVVAILGGAGYLVLLALTAHCGW
jgi:hypothetical protein